MSTKPDRGSLETIDMTKLKGGQVLDRIARFGWTTTDTRGRYAEIDKNDLHVDPAYQREAAMAASRQIASKWSWIACGTLSVAKRKDGSYFVIDGGHRLLAALHRSDIHLLPCLVFNVVNEEQESKSFIVQNQQTRRMSPFDLLRAELHCGDPVAVAITGLVESCGMTFGPTSSSTPWHAVRCINQVKRLYSMNRDVLEAIWPVVAETAKAEQQPVTDKGLGALHYIESRLVRLGSTSSLTRPPWRGRVVAIGCTGLHNAANKAAAFYATGGDKIYAGGVLQVLNYKVRNKLTIDPADDQA